LKEKEGETPAAEPVFIVKNDSDKVNMFNKSRKSFVLKIITLLLVAGASNLR
jgi:hypothetical protein